jgi:hypothetical protein
MNAFAIRKYTNSTKLRRNLIANVLKQRKWEVVGMGKMKWIAGAIKHPGSLRKALHVKEGENIPEAKIKKAEKSKNPTMAKRARLAETLRGLKKR